MIRRRKVFFITGYDPRSPAVYYRLIASEYRGFLARAGVEGTCGKMQRNLPPQGQSLGWQMTTHWPEGTTVTDFELLGWRDLITREFRFPAWRRIWLGLVTFAAMVRRNHFIRYIGLKLEGAAIAVYPFAMMFLYLAVMAGLVVGGALLAGTWLTPLPEAARWTIGGLAGATAAFGFYQFTRRIDQTLYAWYLINDWISMRDLARDRDPELDRRISQFAKRIAAAVAPRDPADAADPAGPAAASETTQASEAAETAGEGKMGEPACEEVLVVGHSSGAILAVIALHRALAGIAVDAGRRPRLSLLTLGSNFFSTGMFRPATLLKEALTAIGRRADVAWADVFAPQDIMSLKIDPVRAYADFPADERKPNPALVSAHLAKSLEAERYRRVRWRFFTLHFQFMVAPDHPGHYDFHRCLAGPDPLKRLLETRFAMPPAAPPATTLAKDTSAAPDSTVAPESASNMPPAAGTPETAILPEAPGTPEAADISAGTQSVAPDSDPSDPPGGPGASKTRPAGALEKHPA